MDDFGDMFADQTEVGEPGEHDLGLDDASEEAFYDPPPYEPPRNIVSPDRSPIGQAFDTVIGFIPNPTTLKGAFDLGLGILSGGTSLAGTSLPAVQFASGANTMVNLAGRTSPPSSSSTKGFTQPGPHPDEGRFDIAGAPPPSGAPPTSEPPMQMASEMATTQPVNNTMVSINEISPFDPGQQAGPMNVATLPGNYRDPDPFNDDYGPDDIERNYVQTSQSVQQAPELAPINPAAYESYFMGYDPDYDPYSAGFVGQPTLYGRREVVAEGGGGIMNLRKQANQLAAQGRGGDTMLMHMRPDEVAGLASLGGVTRNPTTGLPEGFLLPALGALGGSFLGGSGALAGLGALAAPLGIGLGAGAGQALQSKMLGEDDPLKKGMVAGLTAGLGSAALGKLGSFMSGAPDQALKSAGASLTESITKNPLTTAGILGGVGGAASDAYAMMPNSLGMFPKEGTAKSKSFREPQMASPRTPRERTGLAQSGDLTSYGFGPEGLFFGEGVYAEDGGRPVKRMSPGGFAKPLMSRPPIGRRLPRSLFGDQSQGVQGSVSEATQNLGEAGNALQVASEQVRTAQGTLDPNMRRGGFSSGMFGGLANLFGSSNRQQMQQEQQLLQEKSTPLQMPRRMEDGGIASMPQEGGDAVALQVTQDAVEAVRGEHPEPEIAIESFVSYFGPEAFESLRRLVIQEESARTMGKADGLVNGDDGGRDDVQRGTIDGDQELNISGGEYIFSADDVALIGDGNTEAGARRLDEARDNLRRSARGTTKRPAYMGEGAATKMMEEVMTT